MSNGLGHYAFLPWLREGISSRIMEEDTLGSNLPAGAVFERPLVQVDLVVEDTDREDDTKNETVISKSVKIMGPGDVIGIHKKAVVRTEPRRHLRNVEENMLVYIEFYEEDFPWRFTPAAPPAGNIRRLRPWIWLLALKDDEFQLFNSPNGPSRIAMAEGKINDVFPEHDETWAWAHVHLNYTLGGDAAKPLEDEVNEQLDNDPDIGISRLVCPRKLNRDTHYTVFLIPAFETGRLAGLGEDPSGIKAQTPSWRKGEMPISNVRPLEFPVYYNWDFTTGSSGDFESLVTKLKPVQVDPEGKRPMDIQTPGYGLETIDLDSKTLGMQGALKPIGYVPAPWPNGRKDKEYVQKMTGILNLSKDLETAQVRHQEAHPYFESAYVSDDPIVVPPIYGQWHAPAERLGDASNPSWIEELNKDPRHRAAAGLGTRIVQKNQEEWMNEAWKQIDRVNEANQKIREARMAEKVAGSLFAKHVRSADPDKLIIMTSLIQSKIPDSVAGNKSIAGQLRETRVPAAARSASLNRLTRPEKKFNRKIAGKNGAVTTLQHHIITNFGKEINNLTAARLKEPPINAITLDRAENAIDSAIDMYESNPKAMAKEYLLVIVDRAALETLDKTALLAELALLHLHIDTRVLVEKLIDAMRHYEVSETNIITITLAGETFREFFGTSSDLKSSRGSPIRIQSEDAPADNKAISGFTTLGELKMFKASFDTFQATARGFADLSFKLPFLENDVTSMRNHIIDTLNPRRTIMKRIGGQIKILENGGLKSLQELKPVMAYPEFPESLYTHLGTLSNEYIIPNIEKIPGNSVTLLLTNQVFIEAFFGGMNHEMARELLWREYPTDQRGTYFRTFWDGADNIVEEDVEELKAIKPMHEWYNHLGNNRCRRGAAESLVLVVRGELFVKYPHTMVYAQRAQGTRPNRELDPDPAQIRYPIFSAALEPDIYLFGFDLDPDEARGNPNDPEDPGFFIVFKERPGQIKLGFDNYTDNLGNTDVMPPGPPDTWNDMSWEHLVNAKSELDSYFINFSKPIDIQGRPSEDPVFGDNSADMASILYQNPLIFARHAQEMLPE